MAKIYLPAGSLLTSSVYTRVGPSGSVVDTHVDWGVSLHNSTTGAGVDPYLFYTALDTRFTYEVHVEEPTGRFWYDDAEGY